MYMYVCKKKEKKRTINNKLITKYIRLIGSYIRSWESPGDLSRVIEILCLFASGRSPGLSQQRM